MTSKDQGLAGDLAAREPLPGSLVIAALRAMDTEARKRGAMFPQTADEQDEDTKAVRKVIKSLEFYTSDRQSNNGWPSVKDWPALPARALATPVATPEPSLSDAVPWQYKVGPIMRMLTEYANAFHAYHCSDDEENVGALRAAKDKKRAEIHDAVAALATPTATPEAVAWVALADSDWVNVVNAPSVLDPMKDKEEAVREAVKLTEGRLKALNALATTATGEPPKGAWSDPEYRTRFKAWVDGESVATGEPTDATENAKASDAEVLAWAERHDIRGSLTDLSAMFDDARSLHLAASKEQQQ